MDFSTTLLREKFTIRDLKSEADPVIALSNRVVVTLADAKGRALEKIVIRTQMMHTCLRMAARIVHSFERLGPLMARDEKFDFQAAWSEIVRDYEQRSNARSWISIYNGGRRVFSAGDYHAFLDIIENCDHKNASGHYDASVFLAQDIFAAKGKNITIDHEANTGTVLDIRKNRARCGLILRSPVRRTNFNYTAEPAAAGDSPLIAMQCLNAAAAFLEGIHLSFIIGRINENKRLGETGSGAELQKAESALQRLGRLGAELKSFENSFNVSYRPDRPEFPQIIIEAEKFTRVQWEAAQAEEAAEQEPALERED